MKTTEKLLTMFIAVTLIFSVVGVANPLYFVGGFNAYATNGEEEESNSGHGNSHSHQSDDEEHTQDECDTDEQGEGVAEDEHEEAAEDEDENEAVPDEDDQDAEDDVGDEEEAEQESQGTDEDNQDVNDEDEETSQEDQEDQSEDGSSEESEDSGEEDNSGSSEQEVDEEADEEVEDDADEQEDNDATEDEENDDLEEEENEVEAEENGDAADEDEGVDDEEEGCNDEDENEQEATQEEIEEKRNERMYEIVNSTTGAAIHQRHMNAQPFSLGEFPPGLGYSLVAAGVAEHNDGVLHNVDVEMDIAVWKSNPAVILMDVLGGTVEVEGHTYTIVVGYALYSTQSDMMRIAALVVDDETGDVMKLKLRGNAIGEDAQFPILAGDSVDLSFEGNSGPSKNEFNGSELDLEGTVTALVGA